MSKHVEYIAERLKIAVANRDRSVRVGVEELSALLADHRRLEGELERAAIEIGKLAPVPFVPVEGCPLTEEKIRELLAGSVEGAKELRRHLERTMPPRSYIK